MAEKRKRTKKNGGEETGNKRVEPMTERVNNDTPTE